MGKISTLLQNMAWAIRTSAAFGNIARLKCDAELLVVVTAKVLLDEGWSAHV
jgi:hypothetical protein